jgi:hypothetical protein
MLHAHPVTGIASGVNVTSGVTYGQQRNDRDGRSHGEETKLGGTDGVTTISRDHDPTGRNSQPDTGMMRLVLIERSFVIVFADVSP